MVGRLVHVHSIFSRIETKENVVDIDVVGKRLSMRMVAVVEVIPDCSLQHAGKGC